jgi:putative transposase
MTPALGGFPAADKCDSIVLARRFARRGDEMGTALQITRTDHTSGALRSLAGKCRDGAQVRRLLALTMVLDGHSRSAAASSNGMDRQTLRDWVHRYNQEGVEGLKTRSIPGRTPSLTASQMAGLYKLVVKDPDLATDKVVRWRCVDRLAVVKRRFSVEVHESTIGKWLHQLGLTRLQPRPVHPKKDPDAEARFKKLRQPGGSRASCNHRRDADRNLVPGRGQSGSKGHARLHLGTDRLTASDGAR